MLRDLHYEQLQYQNGENNHIYKAFSVHKGLSHSSPSLVPATVYQEMPIAQEGQGKPRDAR